MIKSKYSENWQNFFFIIGLDVSWRKVNNLFPFSVPSQQHLIVDSDSVRSRFQALQANGFRSSSNKVPPPLQALPPATPPIKSRTTHSPPPQNSSIATQTKVNSSIHEIGDRSSNIDEITKTECETRFNGDKSPKAESVPPDTPSGGMQPLFGRQSSITNRSNDTASITNSPVRF